MLFGHIKNNFNKEKIGAKCGEKSHDKDKDCPIRKDEVEIKRIQTEKRITIKETRIIRREQVLAIPRIYITKKIIDSER